jgi:DNA polymerase-3 subunit beta
LKNKQFLNGIFIKNEGNTLRFVSTDGYRLSVKTTAIEPLSKEFSVIVPHKAVSELNRIIQNEDNDSCISINLSENQVAFQLNTFMLLTRVIQGQFPDYKQVIPNDSKNEFKVSRRALLAAAERSSIIAAASNNVVRLVFNDNLLNIMANAAGLGEFKEKVEVVSLKGNGDTKIAFNIRLMLDVLKTLECDEIIMKFNNELSPSRIEEVDNDEFIYIIMPIRTSDYQNE